MCFIILRKSEFTYSFISGHCTEYSSNGNLIQSNRNTNCMNFSSKPCPVAYKSTEAYKCMLDCFFFYNACTSMLIDRTLKDRQVFLPSSVHLCVTHSGYVKAPLKKPITKIHMYEVR